MFQSKSNVAALSLSSSTLLTVLKLTAGLSTDTASVLAEGVHSGVTLLSALIVRVAGRLAALPPDEEYPYGRGKIENILGTGGALLLFLAAGMIAAEAGDELIHGTHPPQVDLGLTVMAVSFGINILISVHLLQTAWKTRTWGLEVDACRFTTDVLTSLGVFGALVAVRLTGLAVLDPIVGLVLAGLITRAAWDIAQQCFVDLLDRGLSRGERTLIAAVLKEHSEKVASFHGVRSRRVGSDRYVDLNLMVGPEVTVAEAHALCDHLERDLRRALGTLSLSAHIHVEPCRQECTRCQADCRTRSI